MLKFETENFSTAQHQDHIIQDASYRHSLGTTSILHRASQRTTNASRYSLEARNHLTTTEFEPIKPGKPRQQITEPIRPQSSLKPPIKLWVWQKTSPCGSQIFELGPNLNGEISYSAKILMSGRLRFRKGRYDEAGTLLGEGKDKNILSSRSIISLPGGFSTDLIKKRLHGGFPSAKKSFLNGSL